ncbi:MAG: hypothetical protein V2I54_04820 [Bacteroidales bacterium]|jgi:hypothetical protein|nr:hypothetical protein [Bacteroidales bacterium]
MSINNTKLNNTGIRKGNKKKYFFILSFFLFVVFQSNSLFACVDADFSVDKTTPIVDETVTFTDESIIINGGGTINGWSWDFDNNGSEDSDIQNPSYSYSSPGLKTVSLTVSKSGGFGGDDSDTETKTNYIQVYQTYYSIGSGDPVNTNSWNTQPDGSGTAPANTTGDCLNFIIQNGHTMTTTGTWTLGQYSTIQIEDGELVENHTITIQPTGSLQVDATGTLSHNVSNLSIFGGSVTIGSGSTVSYGGSGAQQIFNTNYSNLTVTGTGIKQVNNNLTIPGTFNSGAQLDVSANITFNGPVICNGGGMNAASGVVTYNTAATNIVAGLYNNLTKTGGGTSTLCGDVTVANILNLDNGIIRLADADLTVSNDITGTFDASNMIETNGGGMLIKQGTDAGLSIVYPVGSAGFYTPMDLSNGITASYSGTGSISVRAVAGSQGAGLLQKYWEVNTQNITSITDVYPLFTYDLAEADATQPNYLPWYNPGAAWENPINSTGAGVNPFGSTSTTQLAGKWTAGDKVPLMPDIYYSYQTGDWDNPDTWTFDPGGTTLTPTDIPNENDKVVILNGRTVTLTSDVDTAGLDIKVKDGATLDLATFSFSNGIGTLQGQGTVKLASVNYPSVTSNLFVLAGGGTTEYYNAADFTLPAAQTQYNHLQINAPGIIATQLSDITLNGDLNVLQGTYRINDNAAAARRKLTIQGDVLVDNGASITIGTGNTVSGDISGATTAAPFIDYYDLNSHRVVVYGDFTNNGTVKFTNQSYPVYDAFPNNGMATVYFMGATNNTLHCNGTTDFYNLVLDKGIDQTYKLSVYSTAYQNFRLFGRNNIGGENGGANPDLRKALWIRTGTLELKGMTIIPSLVEGTDCSSDPNSDFYIPANGSLLISGSEVIILTTADSYQEINLAYGVSAPDDGACGVSTGSCTSFSILGRLQIDNGYFSTRESGGIITWDDASGELIINGGVVDVKQYRSAGSSGGLASFSQSGGTFLLRGRFQRTPAAYTSINDLKDFSTNTLNTNRFTDGLNGSLATFNISEAANVFSMSGGTIRIYDVCGTGDSEAFQIFSDENNNSVTGGTVEIIPTTGSGGGGDASVFKVETTAEIYNLTINRVSSTATVDINLYDLTVLNNLTITSGDLVANNYDITIGADFVIENGTSYTPGSNWTIFNGSTAQDFEINTGSALNLNKFKLDKPSGSILTLAGTQNSLNVADSLMIQKGTLSDGGKTIHMNGSLLYNSGIHEGSGKIVMNAASPQIITGDGNGIFENIELNNTDGSAAPVSLGANIAINGILTFSQDKLFDISTYGLMFGEDAAIVNAGTNRFIQTAGNAGDGGVSKVYSTSSTSFTFPVGAPSTSHPAVAEYTPATLSFDTNPTTFGTITVLPVGYEHPNTTNKNRSLTYFWRTKSEGFTLGTATINHTYTYAQSDVVTGADITENGYVAAIYDNATYSWTKYAVTEVDDGTNEIGGTGTALAALNAIDGEFTAGDDTPDDPFGVPVVYYSRQTGQWDNGNTWSLNGHSGVAAGSWPGASDIAIVGGQDSVYLATDLYTPNTGLQNAATLKIEQGAALDIGYNPGCNFGIVLSHQNGNGNFRLTTDFTDRSDFVFPNGDFSDYNVNRGTTEFYSVNPATNTYFVLPSNTDSYGTVILSPLDQSNIVFPNISEVTFYGDLITRGTNWESWFGLTWLTTAGYPAIIPKTVTIKGDLLLERGSLVYIGNGGIQQTVLVEGDVIIYPTSGIDVYAGGGQNSFANILSIAGNLINNSNNTPAPSGGHAGSNARFYVNENRKIDLVFTGNSNSSITNTGTTPETGSNPNTILGYVSVNKGNSQATSLTLDIGGTLTTLTDDWLTLENGTFYYEHDGDLRITEGSQFTIPATAALSINTPGNTVFLANDNVNNNDVYLNGKLTIFDGDVYIGQPGAPNNNNDIEYSGGGNSTIDIQGGSLTVNGQIRRNPSTSSGILMYNQSGGDVTVNGRNAITGNAKLEILNAGSAFNMSDGTLTIVRGGGGGTFGDLYLRPDNSTVTGGEIIFDPGVAGAQNFIFDANVPVWDLTVNNNANVELLVSPLTAKNDITIASGGTLDANINFDIPVTIEGNFDNSGIYEHRNNLTTFNGGTQQILGSAAIEFYNLQVNPVTSLTLDRNANVQNNLMISRGTLACDVNTVYVQGNLINNSTYNDNNAGVVLNGTVQQLISGTGTFGTLELDNSQGARLENNITLQKDFILTKGVFDINSKLLSLGENSDIVGSGFSESKMIASDGVYSDVGISKIYTSADNGTTFLYPLGTSAKYTPAVVNITNIDNTGSIRINNINDYHPGVFDENNVLNYFWEIESTGITNFTGSFELNYLDDDVQVTGSNTEADYIAAHLLLPGTSWSKAAPGAATDNVDEGNDIITFNFSGTNSLSGEYTAGIDAALPDNVPEFISNQSGDWSNSANWDQVGGDSYILSGGPNGFIVTIDSDHTITIDEDYVSAYRTTINGTLEVVKPYYGHNIGTVSGSGTLYLESGTFPAGRYTNFFDCSNNATLEYGGTGTYALVADLYSSLPNLHITGTGTRIFPNKDLTICNQLLIDGPALDNSVNKRKLTIQGTMERYNTGTFVSGTGANATVSFEGSVAQTIGGALGDFTGINAFNNLEINNSAGLTVNSGGAIEVDGNLLLTDGNIVTSSTNTLTITNDAINCVFPAGGSSSSYVEGPLTKYINQGDDFKFPVGKGDTLGNKLTLSSIRVGTIAWTVEFFTPNPTYTDFASPLTYVNSKEYWTITANDGDKAKVGLDWDPQSDLTPLMTQNGLSDMRVAGFNTGTTQWEEISSTQSGNNNNGTVTTSSEIIIPASGSNDFTTACVNVTKPRARLNPSGAVCGDEGIPVTFTGVDAGDLDYVLTYEKGGVLQPSVTISSADLPYTLPTDAIGTTYELISFTYNEPGSPTTGVVDPAIITTYTVPTTADIGSDGGLDDDDQSKCGETSAVLEGNVPGVGTGQWSVVSGTGGSFVDPTDPATTFNGTNGTTYTLRWTITNGGCFSSDDVVIAFPLLPEQPEDFTMSSAIVCQGDENVEYTVPNDPSVTYTWGYDVGTGATIVGSGNSVTVDFANNATSGTLYVYTTNGCGDSDPREINVTVNEMPQLTIMVDPLVDTICDGETTRLEIDFTAGSGTYDFTITDGTNSEDLSGVTDDPYTYEKVLNWVDDGSPDTDYNFIITTITDSNGCSNTNIGNESVTVFKIPETGPQYHISNEYGN